MKVGDLVRSRLDDPDGRVGIIIEVRENMFFEDVHCHKWDYPDTLKVWYPSGGEVEINPIMLYELV